MQEAAIPKTRAAAEQNSAERPAPMPMPTPSPMMPTSDPVDLELPEEALSPVAIGGAFLRCRWDKAAADEAFCVAEKVDGGPYSFDAKSAYIVAEDNKRWTATAFSVDGKQANAWHIKLPFDASKANFAVAVMNDEKTVLADWVMNGDSKALNLVQDGGFEELRINPTNDGTSQFLIPDRQTHWKARGASAKDCPSIIELQSTLTAASETSALNDGQWVELDSSCAQTWEAEGNNIVIFQDVKVQKGNLYQLTFMRKARNGITTTSGLKASLNDVVYLKETSKAADWVEYSMTFVATSDAAHLEFEEEGDGVDGRGTLLDNVILRDLGNGTLQAKK